MNELGWGSWYVEGGLVTSRQGRLGVVLGWEGDELRVRWEDGRASTVPVGVVMPVEKGRVSLSGLGDSGVSG